jgi:lysylphosphatidylglycerol synthetase-like protein (DUF2156 family)
LSIYSFSNEVPAQWDAACQADGALFHSRNWQALLEDSFGCRSLYAWDADENCGAAISVFKAGPFRVGYVGFPAGGMIGNTTPNASNFLAWRNHSSAELPTCVRIAESGFAHSANLPLAHESNPETAICDLQNWDLSSVSKNLRRDVRKAQRSDLSIDRTADESAGPTIFHIYQATVKNHGGAVRYNEAYFSGLIKLAGQRSDLHVLLARHQGEIAGFIIAGSHGKTSYYLHGGTDIAYLRHSPADLLLNEAIHHCRDTGSECFNLMSSPNSQPSLVKYKEKWGGETRLHKTYTLAIKPSYPLFKVAEKLYRLLR